MPELGYRKVSSPNQSRRTGDYRGPCVAGTWLAPHVVNRLAKDTPIPMIRITWDANALSSACRQDSTRSAFALIFERDADSRSIGFNLSVLDLHVELYHFRHPQIAQRLACTVNRSGSCFLPRLRAGSDKFDYLVDIFRHDISPLDLKLNARPAKLYYQMARRAVVTVHADPAETCAHPRGASPAPCRPC